MKLPGPSSLVASISLLFLATALLSPLQARGQASGILRERYAGLDRADNSLAQVTNDIRFITGTPTASNILTSFSTELNFGDDYGQRLRAFITAPATGNYTFSIASDEVSQLFLGTNESPASKRLIAFVDPRVQPANYTTFSWQQSSNITLQAGQRYYIEALHKEANLIDHLSVQWRLPNNATESPIPGSRFAYEMAPLITRQPASLTVEEGRPAVFTADVANFLPQHFRWQRNGVDAQAGTNRSYTLPSASLADHGASVQAFITNLFGVTNTAVASLTVHRDTNAPAVSRVISANATNVFVFYSEAVEATSALNRLNYSLAGSAPAGAAFGDDTRTVILTTPALAFGSNYTLSIGSIRDRASLPNALTTTQVMFTATEFNPQPVGGAALAGSVTRVPGGADVAGAGTEIGGNSDQFQFGYQLVAGNFDFKVRVEALSFTDLWAKAGLMARESLDGDSRFAAAFSTPTLAGCFFEARSVAGLLTTSSGSFPAGYPNTWLRLQRVGDVFSGFASTDGENWSRLGSATIAISNRVHLGFAVTSHETNQIATAQFRDFSNVVGGTVDALPLDREPLGPSSRKTGLVISEIMYHPHDVLLGTNQADLEFIELFNSNPFFEDVSGFRLSGDIEYTFPPGTVIAGGSFLVVARSPSDVQAAHGISGVLGPFTNNLPNDAGRVRLRNESGTVLLEVNYSAKFPWPVAANGAGHSLVLARPSHGEGQRSAWSASDGIGGSPGRLDPSGAEPLRPVMINEFLAHTDDPLKDFIELHNHSNQPVDVGGAWLSDNAATNKFRIPSPTIIAPRGFVSFEQDQLGFSLSSAGERVFLVNPAQTRVIDAVGFEPQANGISMGRSPDGAPTFHELASRTPGAANAPLLIRDIVINEIMYNPISGETADEFVELFNKGASVVDVSGWRFTDGIDFTIPSNTVVTAGGYLVVASSRTNLLARHPLLAANPSRVVGDFDGNLRNRGERLALARPEPAINADDPFNVTTNTIYVMVDEVAFGTGGRWGHWSDGGGSSLELIDARADNRTGPNWADSDESAKAPWTNIETTGVLDNGGDPPNALHVMLLEEGECLLDNVEVFVAPAGGNLVSNSTFESGTNGWGIRGNHVRSSLDNEGFNSSRSLHIRATSQGDIGANKILLNFSGLSSGQTATIRAKVRWLRGWPEILLRLRGSWLEATDRLSLPSNLGTPGAVNSRAASNTGPAIVSVTHTPAVPAAGQPVIVSARVSDVDGLSFLNVSYRLDPATNLTTVAMNDSGSGGDAVEGDGVYSATIPGQAADTVVAFVIEATDAGASAASSRYPALRDDNGPVRECLVYFGGPVPASSFGTYRFWITRASITNWSTREVLSNERIPGTFVYGDQRIIYESGSRYSGSPAHQDQAAPDYSPVGTPNNYTFDMPKDDLVLGTDNFNKVHGAGNNHHDDNTLIREVTAYWMARRLGLPANYKRFVQVFINGARRGTLMEDTQVPNNDVVEAVFPNDPDGDLYKIAIWYEFGAPAVVLSTSTSSEANLNNYTTTGGAKKRARYRQNWLPRATRGTANNYTNLFALIDAANTPASGPFVQNMNGLVDMEQWMRTFALEHAVGNWDCFGYRNEQNMFAYKPARGPWQLLIWDINIIFGGGTRGTPVAVNGDLFEIDTANLPMPVIYNTPEFRRAYYRALHEIVSDSFLNEKVDPVMDARFAAFADSGVNVSPPDAIKLWIAQRRAYIESQLALDTAAFTVSTPDGFATNNNLITLGGTAPFAVKAIEINGVARTVTWTTLSNWTIRLPVDSMQTTNLIVARDASGQVVPGGTVSRVLQYVGPASRPEDALVINEIHYNPAVPESSYVEIVNTSTNTAFDLSGWRLNGVDLTFAGGTIITNREVMLLAKNRSVFSQVFGASVFVAGQFDGQLDDGGETLALERPETIVTTNGATMETNTFYVVVDRVKYDDDLPWATAADGTGASLQLIDTAQDNARVSNWAAGRSWLNVTRTGNIGNGTNLMLWLTTPGTAFIDDITLTGPGGVNIVANGGFESDLTGPWIVSTNLTGSYVTNGVSRSGSRSLFLVNTAPGGQLTTSMQQWFGTNASLLANSIYTLSYWILPHTNQVVVSTRTLPGNNLTVNGTNASLATSPGAANLFADTLPPYDPIWLNELQSDNASGIADNAGERDPWIELFNAGTNTIALDGYYLANNYTTNLTTWQFPAGTMIAPAEFKLVWADGESAEAAPGHLHTSFRLKSTSGTVALVRLVNDKPQITDYLTYNELGANLSYGSVPDGQPFQRQLIYVATPRTNNFATPAALFINEWLAGNTNVLGDPADGDFDDWFEIYNGGTLAVDLGGYYLTDAAASPSKFRIPDGYVVPPGGFLLVWADEETGQNNSNRVDLHANFRLAAGGESIGLYSPTLELIDEVRFGAQTNDVSEGRFADGAAAIYSMTMPTPRGPNMVGGGNSPPSLAPIPDRTVTLGQALSFAVSATDPDAPPQTLSYHLDGVVPLGANIDAGTGLFTWTPSTVQSPGTNVLMARVTDSGAPPLSATRTFTVFVVGPPRITGITPPIAGVVSLTLQTVAGKTYRVEYKDSLGDPTWTPLGADHVASSTTLTINDNIGAQPQRFYRVGIVN